MPEMDVKVYDDFRKGQNDTSAPNQLDDAELEKAYNADLSERGGFITRRGVEKYNPTSYNGVITDGIEWTIGNVVKDIIVKDKVLYEVKPDKTLVPKQSVQSDTLSFLVIRSIFYFADGNEIYEWGNFDYFSTTTGAQDIKIGDIVKHTDGKFYQSNLNRTGVDLSAEDYTNTTNWTDVTEINDIISNVIRPIKPTAKDQNGIDITDNNLTPIKKCTMFIQHPSSLRIFAAGNPDDPTALFYSEPNDIGYFKETSKAYPYTNDGKITAICNLSDDLLVSYNNIWYHWRGIDPTTDAIWKPLPIPYGCVAHHSIALTPFSITFLGQDAIYRVSASILSQEVVMVQPDQIIDRLSENKVERTLKTIKNKEKVRAVFHDNKYMLAFSDDDTISYNNKVLVYFWNRPGGFVVYTGWEHYAWYKKTNGELLFTSKNYLLTTNKGYSDIDVDTGEKKGICFSVLSKQYHFGYMLNPKYLRFLFLAFRQHEQTESFVNITLLGDYVDVLIENVDLAESLIWQRLWSKKWGFADMIQKGAEINKIATSFQVLIENDRIDDPVTVYAIGFGFEPLESNPEMISREEDLLQ
ncbi:MAG: hypothetical protein PWP27_216 [Clostridiales bacterium]|jgi:hypothetical protein|nr:hypothetical protein [Clostridiales bacterium]